MINIDLKFFDSADKYGVIKATVHKTGKLGFSSGASKLMNIANVEGFNIGMNSSDNEDKSLYLVPVNNVESEKSFKVVKAGEYFYLFIKSIMRELKIDYKNESVIYEIEEIEGNVKYYKLTRRESK